MIPPSHRGGSVSALPSRAAWSTSWPSTTSSVPLTASSSGSLSSFVPSFICNKLSSVPEPLGLLEIASEAGHGGLCPQCQHREGRGLGVQGWPETMFQKQAGTNRGFLLFPQMIPDSVLGLYQEDHHQMWLLDLGPKLLNFTPSTATAFPGTCQKIQPWVHIQACSLARSWNIPLQVSCLEG